MDQRCFPSSCFSLVVICFLMLGCESNSGPNTPEVVMSKAELVVRSLGDAFNAHDPAAMAEHVADDILWLGFAAADSVYTEADGKEALIAGMGGYFNAVPSVRSQMEDVVVTGNFVAYRERVFWQSEDGERSQAALAVYEVQDQLVQRVWYYPAVAD